MWYRIAEKLSALQILINRRGTGKTWTLMNGVKNNSNDIVVVVGNMEEAKWIKQEYDLSNNVRFVSYNSNLDSLRGLRSVIVVESNALSFIISDAFKMCEELREENEILKSDIHSLKSYIHEQIGKQ